MAAVLIGAGTVDTREQAPASARVQRVLMLLGLLSRVGYCAYATGAVTLDTAGYRYPALAVGTLLAVLVVSSVLGARFWRQESMSGQIMTVDVATGAVALVALAVAIRPLDRLGSLNWALAYSVGCVAWLALGRGWFRPALAALLGAVEAVCVLIGEAADPARTATAVANATSPVLYFGAYSVIVTLVRRTAAEVDLACRREQRQRSELAVLAERERLFRTVHPGVVAALENIAAGAFPEAELRAVASVQAAAVRRVLGIRPGLDNGHLVDRVGALLDGWTRSGRCVDLVEEVEAEPAADLTGPLCAALERLVAAAPADGRIRVRLEADDTGVQVVVRLPGPQAEWAATVSQAGAVLAGVGSIERLPGLAGETRLRLRVPA